MASPAALVLAHRSQTLFSRPYVTYGLRSLRNYTTTRALREKKYTDAHEWIELTDDRKIGTIGVSNYAAKALGDVVYVELPTEGLEISAGDSIGAVESVKSASDIYTPVGGKVIKANSILEQKPGTINESPENSGWIAKIEIQDGEAEKVETLKTAEDYKRFTEE